MIGSTLHFIAQTLNNDLCHKLQIHTSVNKVQLSSIIDASGALTVKDSNILLLKLINIEPDSLANGSGTTPIF